MDSWIISKEVAGALKWKVAGEPSEDDVATLKSGAKRTIQCIQGFIFNITHIQQVQISNYCCCCY